MFTASKEVSFSLFLNSHSYCDRACFVCVIIECVNATIIYRKESTREIFAAVNLIYCWQSLRCIPPKFDTQISPDLTWIHSLQYIDILYDDRGSIRRKCMSRKNVCTHTNGVYIARQVSTNLSKLEKPFKVPICVEEITWNTVFVQYNWNWLISNWFYLLNHRQQLLHAAFVLRHFRWSQKATSFDRFKCLYFMANRSYKVRTQTKQKQLINCYRLFIQNCIQLYCQ